MISGQNLTALLHAVATGHVGRARNLILTTEDIDDDELRKALDEAVESNADGADQARALGDVFRDRGIDQFLVNECYRLAFYLSDAWIELSDNPLYAFFTADKAAHVLDKWVHYFPIYERHLQRFRDKQINVLEIGVYRGGGLRMWSKFLGPQATVVGLDIDEAAVRAVNGRYPVILGDQADPGVLRQINDQYGPFDVVIDDGGHTMQQQIVTTETLFPLLRDGGVFIVEDTHTSYWSEFGGGLHEPGSFIEWTKHRVDDLHSRHHVGIDRQTPWAQDLDGLCCYDSIVVMEKRHRFRPFNEMAGSASFLFADRFSEGIGVELLATRDQALHDNAVLQAAVARAPDEEIVPIPLVSADAAAEVLLLRSELLRGRQILTQRAEDQAVESEELVRTRNLLLESWEQLHAMRHTLSWRVTSPLRSVRRLKRQ